MDNFLELTKMERIETMRLALETIVKARRHPKQLGDITRKVREIAEIYSGYIVQEKDKKQEQPQIKKDFFQQDQYSDLTRSLRAKT